MIPRGMPARIAKIMAIIDSSIVAGNFCAITSRTGLKLVDALIPQSKVLGESVKTGTKTFNAQGKALADLTAKQAAEIAKKSKSKKLILTHIGQRYDNNLKKLLNEAKKVFKKSSLAKDLDKVEV